MKSIATKILLLSIMMVGPGMISSLFAPPPPPPPPAVGAPIDAAVILLIILGTVYGVLKIYKNKEVAQ